MVTQRENEVKTLEEVQCIYLIIEDKTLHYYDLVIYG